MPSDLPPVWTADETDQLAAVVDDLLARVAALETGGVPPIPPTTDGVDLVVVTFTPPTLIQGSSVNLAATVQNRGASPVPAGTIVGVGFALDADEGDTIDEGASLTWASTDAGLGAGATVVLDSGTAQYHGGTWAPGEAGEHVLSAFVDDLNRVPEYDEANNRADVDVTIAERVTGGGGGNGGARRLFAENSPWNTDKGAGLVFAEGADWLLSSASYGINNGAYSHPMTYSTPDDPVHQFAMPATWGWPSCTISARMNDAATPAAGTDGHLFLVADDGRTFDMWILRSTGHRAWRCESWAQHTVDGSGWGQPNPFLAAGITACGAPTGAGTITADDVNAGRIEHALCLAAEWGQQGGNGTCWTGQLPPAVASDVNGGPGPLAEGALLVATGNPPAGLNAAEAALFDACKKYGVYVVDKLDGAAPQFYGDRSDAVGGAFRGDKVTEIGRHLRMVVTW